MSDQWGAPPPSQNPQQWFGGAGTDSVPAPVGPPQQGQYQYPGESGPQAPQPPQPAFVPQPPHPPYGMPEPYGSAGAFAGAPYGGAIPKQTNGLALAGAITSIIPIVGLVLSIIGLARVKTLGGAGRTAGVIGIVLGLLFTGGIGFGIYKLVNSTAADPACLTSEADILSMDAKITSDESAMSSAASSGDAAQQLTAANALLSDLQAIKADLDRDVAKATHADVKAKISILDDDLGTVTTDLKLMIGGDSSVQSSGLTAINQMETDANAVDKVCSNVTNG